MNQSFTHFSLMVNVLLLAVALTLFPSVVHSQFGPQNILDDTCNDCKPASVFTADLDGDGDMDVLSASGGDDRIAWYENLGFGNFGSPNMISTEADFAVSVFSADLDDDGDMDVLSASEGDDKVAWYENLGGGIFSTQNIISDQANFARSVYAADLDGDEDLDVLSASAFDDKIAWYENLGGGTFSTENIISTGADAAATVQAVDLDNDGDMDVLAASAGDDKVAWHENQGGGTFSSQNIISLEADFVRCAHAADLDNDGDMDVVSASINDNKIAWYENLGAGDFGSQNLISSNMASTNGASWVYTEDLDGDGDMDVLCSILTDDKVVWYENLGDGNFGNQNIITIAADGARSVFASDLDGDGDMDVLSASSGDNKLAWYENTTTTALFDSNYEIFDLKVYPNPVNDYISFRSLKSTIQGVELTIFNSQGQLVKKMDFSSNLQVRLGDLNAGLYTIKITVGAEIYVGDFVKQ
ncbi:MAG: T9SS type A sorting domain-containing protein [Bacteroidota bacterium]